MAYRTAWHDHFRGQLFHAPVPVRHKLRAHTHPQQLALVARMRPQPVLPDLTAPTTEAQAAAFAVAQTYPVLARITATITHLDKIIKEFDTAIDTNTAGFLAPLRAEPGVGPIRAASADSAAALFVGYV